jgi:hypothetical protein
MVVCALTVSVIQFLFLLQCRSWQRWREKCSSNCSSQGYAMLHRPPRNGLTAIGSGWATKILHWFNESSEVFSKIRRRLRWIKQNLSAWNKIQLHVEDWSIEPSPKLIRAGYRASVPGSSFSKHAFGTVSFVKQRLLAFLPLEHFGTVGLGRRTILEHSTVVQSCDLRRQVLRIL